MKKLNTLTIAAAMIALATGCGGTAQSTPTPETSAASASVTSAPSASLSATAPPTSRAAGEFATGKVPDSAFVETVRARTTTLTAFTDADLPLMGRMACAGLANNDKELLKVMEGAVKATSQPAFNAQETDELRDLGYVMGAGVSNYCPQSAEKLKSMIPAG